MEFSNQYLTYNEYFGLGGQLQEMPFNLLEYEARKRIDSRTQGRLIGKKDIPEEVKLCVYKLINEISSYIQNSQENKNIASKSIDGVSITYVDSTQIQQVVKSKQAEIDDIIFTYLVGVIYEKEHILFLGVC